MKPITLTFAEYLLVKSALQSAIADASHQAWRGQLHNNPEMQEHFEEHANTLRALTEKLSNYTSY